MSKCSECRQNEGLDTWKDKLASWLAWHLFPKTLKDERAGANTQGFTDGYNIGRKHEREIKSLEQLMKTFNDIPKA